MGLGEGVGRRFGCSEAQKAGQHMSGHAGLGVERAGVDAHGGGGHGLRGGGGSGPIGEEGARTSRLEPAGHGRFSMDFHNISMDFQVFLIVFHYFFWFRWSLFNKIGSERAFEVTLQAERAAERERRRQEEMGAGAKGSGRGRRGGGRR